MVKYNKLVVLVHPLAGVAILLYYQHLYVYNKETLKKFTPVIDKVLENYKEVINKYRLQEDVCFLVVKHPSFGDFKDWEPLNKKLDDFWNQLSKSDPKNKDRYLMSNDLHIDPRYREFKSESLFNLKLLNKFSNKMDLYYIGEFRDLCLKNMTEVIPKVLKKGNKRIGKNKVLENTVLHSRGTDRGLNVLFKELIYEKPRIEKREPISKTEPKKERPSKIKIIKSNIKPK